METNKENVTEVTENIETKKENISLKQMSRIAAIAGGVLGAMLMISITVSNVVGLNQIKESINVEVGTVTELQLKAKDFFKVDDKTAKKVKFDTSNVDLNKVGEYKAIAKCDGKEYSIKVIVEDTKAPKVSMAQRYIFTNDIAALKDFSAIVKEVKDASKTTAKLVRFEKIKDLAEVNDLELRNVTEGATAFAKAEDALAVGTETVPTEVGIYRSVLEIKDAYENASYEEVIVILDTTAAIITDVADQTVNVSKDKLNEQPEVRKSLYSATDNVDGYIAGDKLTYEVTCRDEAKHEWIVKVSYTDRAGNVSAGEFLITVKEKKTSNNSGSNAGGASNSGSGSNGGNNSNSGSNGGGSALNGGYDPADTDRDGTVSTDEQMSYITPEKQACIDAGYGVVVELQGGEMYAVLMKSNTHTINGKRGSDILREYLAERGLEGDVGGCWIEPDNEWYWFQAEDVHEIPEDDASNWEW